MENGRFLLIRLRKKKKFTQKILAEKFRISRSLISQFECGKREISELWARRFGDYFMVSWKKFVNDKD